MAFQKTIIKTVNINLILYLLYYLNLNNIITFCLYEVGNIYSNNNNFGKIIKFNLYNKNK